MPPGLSAVGSVAAFDTYVGYPRVAGVCVVAVGDVAHPSTLLTASGLDDIVDNLD